MNREKKRRKYAYRSVPHEIQGDINEFVICLALNLMHLLYVPSSFSRYFFDKATQNKLQCIFSSHSVHFKFSNCFQNCNNYFCVILVIFFIGILK